MRFPLIKDYVKDYVKYLKILLLLSNNILEVYR